MKPLALPLYKKPKLSIEAGILLLGLVVTLCVGFVKHHQLSTTEKTVQTRITQMQLPAQHKQRPNTPNKNSDIAKSSLKTTEKSLMFTWAPLFTALENAQTSDVSLLSIEPYHTKQALTLVALAKDKETMFNYAKRLQAEKILNKVHISRHSVQLDMPGQPIEFAIEAEMIE